MIKKLVSLLLSLMLCLSLLSTQALAVSDSAENNPPPNITETPTPNEPDVPIATMCMMPGDSDVGSRPND